MSEIGKNIKLWRERRGMTAQELALKIRVGTKTIENYESGEQIPNTNTILKISTVLDVPASDLQGNKGKSMTNNQ
ncbi:helix-turn-helix transcriptional regulator [Bacillus aquiflavi]|uniref:Helix-turn-helix transcriptional regulator n=1 Tax=Bacillus aquiflavi TaxID=2672567 RepID=A0A6B3VR18_9BACI|nr:helix-turn-helix transcriptional regulator [Bacillus aquiflavi]MBA4536045.1 helix-turn-helix transcriptional regulator [Bacillus aquiflavi]NEY80419.1 helix-turn-helix transcriptional regulator [Bacillus aquiflavi]UAC47674.1 helix-turn-helix domain-containing protein [Bacillus aquiflavi]